MRYKNNPILQEFLRKGEVSEPALIPEFELDEADFSKHKIEIYRQRLHEQLDEIEARAVYRMLTLGGPKPKPQPVLTRWQRLVAWGKEFAPKAWPWIKIAWAVAVLVLLLVGIGWAEPQPLTPEQARAVLFGQITGLIVQVQNQGSVLATRPAGLLVFKCSTNMSCSFSGSTFTLAASTTAGSAWSSLTAPTANLTMSHGAFTTTFTYNAATGAGMDLFNILDTTGNTGTGYLFAVNTVGTSAAKPIRFTAGGTVNGIEMDTTGQLGAIGTGNINATKYKGGPASGTGSCAANNWVSAVNDAAAPTCAQLAFSNISGVATKVQLPSTTMYTDQANAITGGLVSVNLGTTPSQAFLFDIAQPAAAGTRNSHFLEQRGTSFDTAGHNADWRTLVTVATNAGASALTWQSRIDASAFTQRAALTDVGEFNVATGFQIGGAAASGNYLRGNGTDFVSSAMQLGDVPAHNVLSTTHSDTTAASVVRGDLITGQGATPKWTRLALGTSGQSLTSNGTDAVWGSCGAGGATALSNITGAIAANTINNGDNAQTWNWSITTASKTAFTIGENVASTGSGATLWRFTTLSGSTAAPFQADANGVGVKVASNGDLTNVGAPNVNLGGATSLTVPKAAGATPTAQGDIRYDTTQDCFKHGGRGTITGCGPRVLATCFCNSTACSCVGTGATAGTFTNNCVSGGADANCTNTGTTETNFGMNWSVPANFLFANKLLRATILVETTMTATIPTFTFRAKLGTTVVYSTPAVAPSTANTARGHGATFVIQGTAAPGASVNVETAILNTMAAPLAANAPFHANATAQPVAVATNAAQTLQFSLQLGTATIGNFIRLRQMIVEELN